VGVLVWDVTVIVKQGGLTSSFVQGEEQDAMPCHGSGISMLQPVPLSV